MSEVSTEVAPPKQSAIVQQEIAEAPEPEKPENPLLAGIANLSMLKQLGLMFGLAASIALGISVVFWSQGPEMRPLGHYEDKELIAVINYLEENSVSYKLEKGGTVMVIKDEYENLRLNIVNEGIGHSPHAQDEMLSKDTGFGVSDKLETARLLRGKEKGLARTIEQFSGVLAAEVHLAVPKSGIFIRDKREPRASVLLTVKRYKGLNEEQVKSIVDLVAGSIPDLQPENVTVTDQFGRQLQSIGQLDGIDSESSKVFKAEKKRETELKRRIEEVLGPLVGFGKYTVQVDVDMDFSRRENTQKTHNSDLPAIRSERTVDDFTTQSGVQGVPGALSNQPPQEADIPQNLQDGGTNEEEGNGNRRLERERNYDLDTLVSHVKQQTGTIRRISVAIGLDYVDNPEALKLAEELKKAAEAAAEGEAEEAEATEEVAEENLEQAPQETEAAEQAAEPENPEAEVAVEEAQEPQEDIPLKISRTVQEIENIRRLVQGIIGFMPQRGDVIEIVSIPFAGIEAPEPVELMFYETVWFEKLQKPLIALITIMFLIFGLLRPIMKMLAAKPVEESELDMSDSMSSGITLDEPEPAPDEVTISHDFGALGLPEPALESAAAIKQAQTIAMDNSHLVANVIRNWMEEDA
ncbi:MAG: flagellar basal-body MS-ring/collar protein FliF [Pseudomonadota bacterium]